MNSRASHRSLGMYVVATVLLGVSAGAFAAAGKTPGTYQVSPAGAATYTIPIWAPRGPDGLQPQIALTYNSQAGSSYLGVGWSVSGLSVIYRCTQTYAQDPAAAPVNLTMSDVFCMDGRRLRLTGGTYGAAGSTYQTEVANFANVTAYGSAGNGPAHFVVQGRDGRTYEYGNTTDSQVLASGTTTASLWYLDKVTDRAGNTMTISYCTDGNSFCTGSGAAASGTAVPVTISWTPSSQGSTSYNYTINFGYSTNVPQSSIYGYVGGAAYSNTSLLTSISVNYTGTTVKQYALFYGQSPTTGRDELTKVQECADAAETNCLAPTQFTYQGGSVGVSTSANTALSSSTAVELKTHNDFNGDGRNDLTYCNGGTPNMIFVVMASSSGYGSPINTGISCTNALFGDLTGSGQDGILAQNGADWWYYTWNGSSFSGQDTGLAYDSTAAQYALTDVNGDGLPDLLAGYQTNTTNQFGRTTYRFDIYVRLNTSSGASPGFSTSQADWYTTSAGVPMNATMIADTDYPYGTSSYGTLKALDFNGDGRSDIALETMTQSGSGYVVNTYEMISGSSSFAPTLITSGSASSFGSTAFLDFNSDNCTDYAYNSVIYVSGCNGSVTQQISLGGATIVGAMDWDGDGRTDILVQNGSTIGVYLSQGDGISSLQTTSIPYNSSDLYAAFNADGDGLDDLAVYGGSAVTYYLHNEAGQSPDLLSSATDGYGNSVSPTYTSILQGAYSDYFIGPAYPYALYRAPLYVVSNVVFSDPTNPPSGTYSQSYNYVGAWVNLQGRGFSNFISVDMHDSRNNVWRHDCWENKFPFSGSHACTRLSFDQAGNQLIRYSFGNHALITLDGTANNERYFIYYNTWTDRTYQVSWTAGSGSSAGAIMQTDITNYAYDNYGNATSITTTKTDNDPGSPESGQSWTTTITNTPDVDTSAWCLTLSSEIQASYTASDGSSPVTRTKQYTPDTTNCRYTQITTEPSSNSYEEAEAIGYDSFGNINADTISGIGVAARKTQANWGTTGQFPMSVTDATGATTQFDYDFGYGFVSSETDPNGLTTSWQDGDGFGRMTQETRPDGTFTTYAYVACDSTDNYCDAPDLRFSVQITDYGLDSSEIDWKAIYENGMDAIRYREAEDLSGGSSYVVTYYDALGRVAERSVPVNESTAEFDTTYSYDVLNRTVQAQRPRNQNDSTLQTTSYAYQGDTTTITDPNGNIRTLIHDPNGWLRETKDDLGYGTTLGYDAAGAKTSVTDNLSNGPSQPLWTGTYAYGVAPFLIGETDVDRGTWGYTVDALGERTAWTDPKGQQFQEQYDALSRPVTRSEPDLYTQWTWGSSAASHNIGKLASVCTGTGSACSSSYYSESEAYDSLGRMSQRAIAIPGMGTYTYTWQYNGTTGLLDTLTYPVSTSGQALQLKYGYRYGILQSITDVLDSPNVTIWQTNAQDPEGQNTQETLGNGLVTNHAYDSVTDLLSSVQSGPGGGSSVQNQSFLYDEVGNVTQRQDNNLGLTESFYYDNDYRLSYSTLNGTQNLALNYDQKGNITSRTDVAGGATWTYDPVHVQQVTQAGSSAYAYAYDANGNTTSRQGSSITWTSYNYPSIVNDTATGESVSFSYGPDRRAWFEETQSSSGTELAYHVGAFFDIISSGGVTDFRHYIYAGGELIAIDSRKSDGTNSFYYPLSDHQGSIAAITNSTGGVIVGENFTAYGARRNPTTWSGAPSNGDLTTIAGITRHGYTFQDALGSMGLNDMVGRVQDSITGRFLSADPTIPDPQDPQSYNRYSYVVNNPLSYTDPSGFGGGDCAN